MNEAHSEESEATSLQESKEARLLTITYICSFEDITRARHQSIAVTIVLITHMSPAEIFNLKQVYQIFIHFYGHRPSR